MKRTKLKHMLIFLCSTMLIVTSLLSPAPTVRAEGQASTQDENEKVYSAADLLALAEQLEQEGAFTDATVARLINTHLTSVVHYEKQGDADKVSQHMESFKVLLEHQHENGMISDETHEELEQSSDLVLGYLDPLVIVDRQQANAVVIIEDNAAQEIQETADVLVEYVEKSTGKVLPVQTLHEFTQNPFPEHIRIYIGHPAPGEEVYIEANLEGLDPQSFMIHPQNDTLTIIGPTVFGTRNGVFELLERYLGIRWLMPGPEGEDVPSLSHVIIPRVDVVEEPVFTHRLISAALDPDLWWQANKIQLGSARPIRFQENLYSLFPPEKFAETHPEFYPNGRPPAPGENHTWQPCFTAEGSIDAAVDGLLDYFAANPDVPSYSLGINDTTNFCETNPNHPHYPNKINSIGLVDMSDIYYAWVNEVVERVLEVYPDKWFGMLAYFNVMDPPSFPLHERVVPFITKERLTWIDEDIKNDGHQQMEAWKEKASLIGWYDYMYGVHYVAPRVFPHVMAENMKYAAENQVYGHYIEMYHNAGDGPKAWIAAKLMWDPYQDVDALLDEWYERVVGPEAASDLAALYELWEEFWTERIQQSPWFQGGKIRTWLPFSEQTYMHIVTEEDIEESMRLAQAVVDKAGTDLQKARAQKIFKMFQYYEASALSYPRVIPSIENEADALQLLTDLESHFDNRVQFTKDRVNLREEFARDPILRFRSSRWYEWSAYNHSEFWHLVNYIRNEEAAGGPVTDAVYELAAGEPSEMQQFAQLLQGVTQDTMESYTENASYETGNEDAPPWTFWNPNRTATIERVEGISHTGNASVLLENADRAGTYQIFDVKPGLTAAEVYYYSPPGTVQGGVRLVATLQDEEGNTLGDFISPTVSLADTAGSWASVGVFDRIPVFLNGKEVKQVLLNAQVWNAVGSQVYLDDADLYVLEEDFPGDGSFTKNSSFEYGLGSAEMWSFWKQTSPGTMRRVEGVARSGNASVMVDGINRGGPNQTFDFSGGPIYTQFYYSTPTGTQSSAGTIQLGMHAKDENGVNLVSYRAPAISIEDTSGEWVPVMLDVKIPEEVNGVKVERVQVVATVDSADDVTFYIDDFEVRFIEAIEGQGLTANPSFEIGTLTATPWGFWKATSPGTIRRVEGVARTGTASVLLDGVNRGGPHQYFKVEPGPIHASAYFYTPPGTETNGVMNMSLNVKDADGTNLVVFRAGPISLTPTIGEWSKIEIINTIPEAVNGVPVDQIQAVVTVENGEGAQVHVDDFIVFQDLND